MRMYVEIIPDNIIYVVRETLKHVAERSGAINNAIIYKALDDAVIDAKDIRPRLISEIKSQALFFVFG